MNKGMGKMGRIGLAVAAVVVIALSYEIGLHHSQPLTMGKTGRHVLYYVDPMHPAYKSDKPGVAPDCGMELEPVYAEDAGNAAPSTAARSDYWGSGSRRWRGAGPRARFV